MQLAAQLAEVQRRNDFLETNKRDDYQRIVMLIAAVKVRPARAAHLDTSTVLTQRDGVLGVIPPAVHELRLMRVVCCTVVGCRAGVHRPSQAMLC